MNTSVLHSRPAAPVRAPARVRLALRLLSRLRHGALLLRTPDGESLLFGEGGSPVTLTLHTWQPVLAAMRSGDIGLGESYIAGDWDCDDIPRLIELALRNRDALEELMYGSWWGRLLYRLRHLSRRNSRAGSRKNIHAHYDIGNDFYALWLDPTMTYSSALFSAAEADGASPPASALAAAQRRKYRRILDQLQLQPGSAVLEIGCGWGGFAEEAALHGQCKVTGLTLSGAQLDYARQRAARAGFDADFRLCDYRDSSGEYDAVASIEMLEAVGEAYWDGYFATVAARLKPGGRACIQTITIDEALFARYRAGSDFIQQYIFPGGMLPTKTGLAGLALRHGLQLIGMLAFGADYAATLAQWRRSFNERAAAVQALGYDQRFMRTWEFYLVYCEGAFRAGSTDVVQLTLQKE